MTQALNIDQSVFARRKRANKIGLVLSMMAMGLGMIFLVWILAVLFIKGFSAINLHLFTASTPAPGSEGGGLANAIVGSLMLIASCTLISTPVGVLGPRRCRTAQTEGRQPCAPNKLSCRLNVKRLASRLFAAPA